MRDTHMKKLLALLKVENAILRRGDLASLSTIAEQKELLMKDIGQLRGSLEDISALRAAAERNVRLLAAAITGVKDARQRLAALAEVQSELNVYDAKGTRKNVTTKGGALERKA